MIYLFHGSDVEKARTKAFEWVAKARAKEPNLVYARLSREEINENTLEEVSSSGGLFVKRLLVLIDDPFSKTRETDEEEKETGNVVEEFISKLAASDNAIIILAPKLAVTKARKIITKAKVEYKYDKSSASAVGERGFNSNLVNALGSKNKERLWLEIVYALRNGDAPEMLHGLLHWKARDLMEKENKTWKPQESRRLSIKLIELLQDSRRSGLDLKTSLEKFALSI